MGSGEPLAGTEVILWLCQRGSIHAVFQSPNCSLREILAWAPGRCPLSGNVFPPVYRSYPQLPVHPQPLTWGDLLPCLGLRRTCSGGGTPLPSGTVINTQRPASSYKHVLTLSGGTGASTQMKPQNLPGQSQLRPRDAPDSQMDIAHIASGSKES